MPENLNINANMTEQGQTNVDSSRLVSLGENTSCSNPLITGLSTELGNTYP